MKQIVHFFLTPPGTLVTFFVVILAIHVLVALIFTCLDAVVSRIRALWVGQNRRMPVPTLHRGSPILTRMKVALFVVLLPMLGGCAEIPVSEAPEPSVSDMPGTLLHVIADAPPWVLWVLLIGGSIAWVATAIWADRNGENRAREAAIKFRERGELTAPKQMPDVPFHVIAASELPGVTLPAWVSEPGNRGGDR